MDFMQIFTLVTGVIYIILEIRQKNFMWVIGILTSLASMWIFFRQGLYASFALNCYYLITAVIGIVEWKKAGEKVSESSIHLKKLSIKTITISAVIAVAGTFAVAQLMKMIENPMSYMDSSITVISAIGTWWLVKSYKEQWYLWIVANLLTSIMCASQGLWWMTILYCFYTLSSGYGLYHWSKNGEYI